MPEPRFFWTLLLGEGMNGNLPATELAPFYHQTSFPCLTVDDLVEELTAKGWTEPYFAESNSKFARIETTERGFNTVLFRDYEAALADDQARDDSAGWLANLAAGLAAMAPEPAPTAAELATELDELAAEAHAEVSDLKPCPFCRRSDRLQILGVSFERYDFSEVHCDMVKCHRCDCLVPLAAWQGRMEVKP